MADSKPKTFIDIAREYFPNLDDEQLMEVLWEYTGYPNFLHGDTETELRKQLQYKKDHPNWHPLDDIEKGLY